METELKIFKFISLNSNQKLTDFVQNAYNTQSLISKELLKKMQLNSILTGHKKLIDAFKQKSKDTLLYYVVVSDKKIIGLFTHTYESKFNQIYLNDANIHPNQSDKGYGTTAYEIIKKDIIQSFNPSTICANAVTIAGKKFLSRVGFLPNTSLKSIESNAIYYCNNQKITFIELVNVPENRCMKLAPNIGLYNTLLRDAKINEPSSVLSEKRFAYLHEILLKSENGVDGYLKKPDAIVYPVKNLEVQEQKYIEITDDFSFNSFVLLNKQDIVKSNLKILHFVSNKSNKNNSEDKPSNKQKEQKTESLTPADFDENGEFNNQQNNNNNNSQGPIKK